MFDALRAAKERNVDVLLVDTAGRLQNRSELMEELQKIVRVIKKADPSAPHAVLLVLDATVGQNALSQVEIFRKAAGVTGLAMTKLDGTARGGILVAIAGKFAVPVHFIGVGESVDDLAPFSARDFARAIAGTMLLMRMVSTHQRPSAHDRKRQNRSSIRSSSSRLDLGPLLLFFFANSRFGIFAATATFMVAVLAALAASYVLTRQLPIMPVVTAIIVLVFGGLTLILHNDTFIKIKPTIIYALFGAVLLGGLAVRQAAARRRVRLAVSSHRRKAGAS